MKKNIFGLLVLAGISLLAGCSEDEAIEQPQDNGAHEITITVGMPRQNSRMGYSDEAPTFHWQAGDRLLVAGYDAEGAYKGKGEFTMTGLAGGQQTTFTGATIEGATQYMVYYKAAKLRIDQQGRASIDYSGQTQTLPDRFYNLADYLLLQSVPTQKLSVEQMQAGFRLTMQNCIFRFDIQSLPEVFNNLSSLIFTWSNKNGERESPKQVVVYKNDKKLEKLYLAFDPTGMNLDANGVFQLKVDGAGSYQATAVSTGGKTYQPGYRYNATVSATGETGTITNFEEVKIKHPLDEIWVTTIDGNEPPARAGYTVHKVEGTEYWAFKSDRGTLVAVENGMFRSDIYADPSCLKTVVLPETVIYLGTRCFESCSNLESINLEHLAADALDGSHGIYIFQSCKLPHLVIPAQINKIGMGNFKKCKTVHLEFAEGSQIVELDRCAFGGCNQLKQVTGMPSTLTKISNSGSYDDWGVFQNCSALETIDLSNVTTLGVNSFRFCSALKQVTLNNNISEIPDYCFSACSQLTIPALPSQLETIGPNAFASCYNLFRNETMTIPGSVTTIGELCFENNNCKTLVFAPGTSTLTITGSRAFRETDNSDRIKEQIEVNRPLVFAEGVINVFGDCFCEKPNSAIYLNVAGINLAGQIDFPQFVTLHLLESYRPQVTNGNQFAGYTWKEILFDAVAPSEAAQ